jgi:hypothetical protein
VEATIVLVTGSLLARRLMRGDVRDMMGRGKMTSDESNVGATEEMNVRV